MTGRGEAHGDGWVACAQGHRHWGRVGAAGLLLHRTTGGGPGELLLQHRSELSHHGGTWGLLGGARRPGEAPVVAALREAVEEGDLDTGPVRLRGLHEDDHGGWSYTTVIASALGDVAARAISRESLEVAWWPVDALPEPLHPGFARTWPVLRDVTASLHVVVDAANVVGSRPDGWWKDRAGAARRLVGEVTAVGEHGIADAALPEALRGTPLQHWWPSWVVVVEGAARAATDRSTDRVAVVAAAGSGDDAIVTAVAAAGPGPRLVVTADRELRARCAAIGAVAAGPRWLLGLPGRDAGAGG